MSSTSETTSTARFVAMAALNEFDDSHKQRRAGRGERAYISEILEPMLAQTNQRRRATDLVLGTTRNRKAIDRLLASVAKTPVGRIEPQLVNIIRIAVYELVYRPSTAEYAIINEAVESAKAIVTAKQAGFVNAVLRNVAGAIENRQVRISAANIRSTLPQTDSYGCEFARRFLPDPSRAPAEYLHMAFSLPKWLVAGWLDEFGLPRTQQLCRASNRKPTVYLRPNTLKTSTYHLAEILSHADVAFEIAPDDSMIWLKGAGVVTGLSGYAEGLFTVQDLTAAEPVRALRPQPGWKMLDLCAAPGTKSTQLAELTEDKALIFATDIDAVRLEKVRQNADRLNIASIEIIPYDQLQNVLSQIGPVDAVLLDVPCSNTGVLAKRPEVRYRIRPRAVERLAGTQKKLLETAKDLIKPAGKILYSTCSIQKQENSQVIAEFLRQNSEFELVCDKLTLPSAENFDHDGGYWAIVTKR